MCETIPVFVASDDSYSPFIAVTISSIMQNTDSRVDLYILSDGISERNQMLLNEHFSRYANLKARFYEVDMTKFNNLSQGWFKNYTTYMRYLIPEMFPEIKKCIYSDIDIIFNSDIKELFAFDYKKFGICAAMDEGMVSGFVNLAEHKKTLSINDSHIYFNAGLMIINVDYWNKNKVADQLLKIAQANKQYIKCPSQDPLNIYFSKEGYVTFPSDYNFMPSTHSDGETGKIYHYTGTKPWRSLKVIGSELFWKYARQTHFYEYFLTLLIKEVVKNELSFTPPPEEHF